MAIRLANNVEIMFVIDAGHENLAMTINLKCPQKWTR